MTACIVYLASPRDWKVNGTTRRFDALVASLRSVRAMLPKLPVIIFHEDYTDGDKASLNEILPCSFERVDFSPGVAGPFVPHRGRPEGYLLMCRFWTGIVQAHPALASYTHYIRLDDDSYMRRPRMTQRAFERMLRCDYSYRQVFWDASPEHEELYRFTESFLRGEGLYMPTHRLLNSAGHYQGKAIYNNFHCASLRLWKDPLVAKYVAAVEAAGGIMRQGWFDANLHTMIVAILMPHLGMVANQELHFGYRHNSHEAFIGSLDTVVNDKLPFIVEPHEYEDPSVER